MRKDVQDRQSGAPDGPNPSAPEPALRRTLRVWGVRGVLGLAFLAADGLLLAGVLGHVFIACAVLGAGVLLLALGLAGLMRWRTGRAWRGACLAGWAGVLGVSVVIYVFAWQPLHRLHAEYWVVASSAEGDAAETRSLCHRLLLWRPHPLGELFRLAEVGDQASVLYILWAWPSAGQDPQTEGTPACLQALRTITNQAPGTTLAAWTEWLEKNRRRSQMAWWADGFVAEGYKAYPFEDKEAPKAARELLAALGRSTWQESPPKRYLTFNAVRMLRKLPAADVRKAMGETLKGESPAEKRGLARYTEYLSRAEGEPMLRTLSADVDRSVRLAATGQLCENLIHRWPAAQADPVWRACEPGQVPPPVAAAWSGTSPGARASKPAAMSSTSPATAPVVSAPQIGSMSEVRRPGELPRAVCDAITTPPGTLAAGVYDKTAWLLRAEGLMDQSPDANTPHDEPYVLHVDIWSLQTGRRVRSRQLTASRTNQAGSISWIFDAHAARLFVSLPSYTAAIDVRDGTVIWEVGYGTKNTPNALRPYLVLSDIDARIILDATEGNIVASAPWSGPGFATYRLRLYGGRLWAESSHYRPFYLDFSTTHAPWSEPAEQGQPERLESTPGTGH